MAKVKKTSLRESDGQASNLNASLQSNKKRLINHLIEQGIISQQTLNLTKEHLKKLYERAYQLYSAGKYKDAKALFAVLLVFNQSDVNFIYGFATCCFMLKEYELAANSYLQCGSLDPANPLPYFYAADCFLHQSDLASACVALRMVVKRANEKSEYAELKQRAQLILGALSQTKTEEMQSKTQGSTP
ncbi:SycD/LcrH family type III secretion system chaperone [Candidatus Protochlamydia phocaeensis]|uniref:SycD/LcrH family type III secretion system chaperone n=1 Tax=Candidatus Protochlamydia phocaeensis TaxID=1414722 RepID=UPI0008397F05|nr:SycD/LcrH family type III secretion system chaperone [Candidatus Protochlamydia phocaeensis]